MNRLHLNIVCKWTEWGGSRIKIVGGGVVDFHTSFSVCICNRFATRHLGE